jgi:predicted metal-dependent hydrolase
MQANRASAQLDLPFGHTEGSLGRHLEERLGRAVSLVLTDNSTSMLSARTLAGSMRVRLHRMFLRSDTRVIEEIVSFLKNKKGAMPHFRKFIRENRDELEKRPPKNVSVKTAGKIHDLLQLFREINEEYFGGRVDAAITWGAKSPRFAVRKRTLGSYSERSHMIRINPMLDRKTVPRYFVAFIVYHEMLHAAMGTPLKGKRRSVHSREFREREKLFRDYGKAMEWERRGA